MNEEKPERLSPADIVDRSVELIFKAAYAPVDVGEQLRSAESRSRIRRLTPPQLFFGLSDLSDHQMQVLLPQVTEEQWRAILDLSLWEGDTADTDRFLEWQRHLIEAADAVAKKLWRATSPNLWELAFQRDLRIARRAEEDTYEGDVDEDAPTLTTPDQAYLIQLPEDDNKATVWSELLMRLFTLEPEAMNVILEEGLHRTPTELEEEAYQERCHRLEDLGFQDYFDAISIYAPIEEAGDIPVKNRDADEPIATLPDAPQRVPARLLLVQSLGQIQDRELLEQLLEEIFFVCNKVLSADRTPPDEPEKVKQAIRKVLAGINLGLSRLTADDLPSSLEALRRHYLAGIFQFSYHHLLTLRTRAQKLLGAGLREDLFEQAVLESLAEPYPRPVKLKEGRVSSHYFWESADLEAAHKQLDQM